MKVAIIGDIHQNIKEFKRYVAQIKEGYPEVQLLIQVGDFGYMGSRKEGFLDEVNDYLDGIGLDLYFIDGNHEDHSILSQKDASMNKVRGHIYYIKRGSVLMIEGHRVLFLGGAYSVDRMWRVAGVSYWPEEVLSKEFVQDLCASIQPVDIMISHDAPISSNIPLTNHMGLSSTVLYRADAHRELVERVVLVAQPKVIYHGHYHVRYKDVMDIGYGEVEVNGLGCDCMPFSDTVEILDIPRRVKFD